jgi:hypothetical protein
MKDIDGEVLQALVARKSKLLSAKSVRNPIALLGEMWTTAKTRNYTNIDPFCALTLPESGVIDERCLTLDEMRLLIDNAQERYSMSF